MIFFSRLNVLSESFFETLVGVVASIIDAWLTYTTYRKYRKRMRKLNYSYIIWVRFCNFVMIEDVYIMWQWHYIGGEILVSWEAKLLLQINSIGKPKKYRFRRRDWIVLDKVIPYWAGVQLKEYAFWKERFPSWEFLQRMKFLIFLNEIPNLWI